MMLGMSSDLDLPLEASPDLPAYIGKYKVLRRLGEGATSDVFLAVDEFRQSEVAIKRMRFWASNSRLGQHGAFSSRKFWMRCLSKTRPIW